MAIKRRNAWKRAWVHYTKQDICDILGVSYPTLRKYLKAEGMYSSEPSLLELISFVNKYLATKVDPACE